MREGVATAPALGSVDPMGGTFFRIAASHIHLTNNRLGIGVAGEVELALMLQKALEELSSIPLGCKNAAQGFE